MELLAILVFYSYLGGWAKSGLTTYAAYMLATSLCLSPWIFNPFSLTVDQVVISCYLPLYSSPTPYFLIPPFTSDYCYNYFLPGGALLHGVAAVGRRRRGAERGARLVASVP